MTADECLTRAIADADAARFIAIHEPSSESHRAYQAAMNALVRVRVEAAWEALGRPSFWKAP